MLSDEVIKQRQDELNRKNFPSEVWFNNLLQIQGLDGYFRRNVCLDRRFFGDFVSRRYRIVIEIDGKSHEGKELYDSQRDNRLKNIGYKVFRIKWGDLNVASEVIEKLKLLFKPNYPVDIQRLPYLGKPKKEKKKRKNKKSKTKRPKYGFEQTNRLLADHDRRRNEFKDMLASKKAYQMNKALGFKK